MGGSHLLWYLSPEKEGRKVEMFCPGGPPFIWSFDYREQGFIGVTFCMCQYHDDEEE